MYVVRGEGPFADAVRKALEYAQSHGVDLSGVEVEVVPDPSITDAGAYTDHLGGLRFRIRYRPDTAGDKVLASHEAGHVAKWAWEYKKRGETQYNPNVDEPLAEAFGAVIARQLYGWPVTFKGAPMNLTQVLPQRTTYITVTVDGKPITVKVPEWGDYRSRYRAGVFVAPYFYNMTNWAHVLGNFTAMPGDVIETVHKAWQSGAVEAVPGWGPVWRTTPTWTWTPANNNQTTDNKNQTQTTTTTTTGDETRNITSDTQNANTPNKTITTNTQKTDTSTVNTSQVTNIATDLDQKKITTGEATILPASVWQQQYNAYLATQEKAWNEYHRVLAQTGSYEAAMATYKNIMASAPPPPLPVVVANANEIVRQFEDRLSEMKKLAEEVNPKNVNKVHEQFIQLRDNAVALARAWPSILNIDKANEVIETVAGAISKAYREAEEERKKAEEAEKAELEAMNKRLDALAKAAGLESFWKEEHGFKHSITYSLKHDKDTGVFMFTPWEGSNSGWAFVGFFKEDGTPVVVKKTYIHSDAEKEYEHLIEKLKTEPEKFKKELEKLKPEPEKEPDAVILSRRLEVLAKLADLPRFWKPGQEIFEIDNVGEVTVRHAGRYATVDQKSGTFMFESEVGPKAGTYFVGYFKEDGTPVVVKETKSKEDAEGEYERLKRENRLAKDVEGFYQQLSGALGNIGQAVRGAVDFLGNVLKTGAGVALSVVGGGKPSPASGSEQQSDEQQFVATTTPQTGSRPIYNRRRGIPALGGSPGSSQPSSSGYRPADYLVSQHSEFMRSPGGQQKKDEFVVKTGGGLIPPPVPAVETGEFVATRPSRAPDYVLAEEEARRAASAGTYSTALDAATQTSSGYRPADYVVNQQSSDRDYTKGRGLSGASGFVDSSGGSSAGGGPSADALYYQYQQKTQVSTSAPSLPIIQLAEAPQTQETSSKRYRGRPVAYHV